MVDAKLKMNSQKKKNSLFAKNKHGGQIRPAHRKWNECLQIY